MKKTTTITRRIQIVPTNKELITKWLSFSGEMHNKCASQFLFAEKFMFEIDAKAKRASGKYATKEARQEFKEYFGKTAATKLYDALLSYEDIPANIRASISNQVNSLMRKEWGDVKSGKRTARTYRKETPLPMPKTLMSFNGLEAVYIGNQGNGTECKITYGADKSGNKAIAQRMLEGEYSICDSSIMERKGKFFLNLVLKIPVVLGAFDSKKALAVDLGIAVPAACMTTDGKRKGFGSIDDFFRVRTQMEKRKRKMQSEMVMVNGGKGRKKKLAALDRIRKKERNFAKNYNHNLSRMIVDFAAKENTGTIVMEDLKGFGNRGKLDRVLRNWSYFELQTMITQKATKLGIEVVKVNPKYTSQTCPSCGHKHPKNRATQGEFKCISCGHFDNADFNACINILRKANFEVSVNNSLQTRLDI